MSPRALILAILVTGCGPSWSQPGSSTLPPLSLLPQADPTVTTQPATCSNGWIMTSVPRLARMTAQAIRGSDGVWHMIYVVPIGVGQAGTFLGARAVSSNDPTNSQSVAWVGDLALARGSEAAPTLFFAFSNANSRQATVTRARLSGGAWQVDDQPIWSGSGLLGALFAAIDSNGHAHVYTQVNQGLGVTPLVLSDSTGSWVATPLTSLVPLQATSVNRVWGAIADKAGHDFVLIMANNAPVVVTNVSGTWQQLSIADNLQAYFATALDGNDGVHLFAGATDGIHDTHITAAGAADSMIMATMRAYDVLAAQIDTKGNPVLVASDTSAALWTRSNGSWQSSPLPLSDYDPQVELALDAQDKPHLAVDFTAPPGVPASAGLGFLDPCP